MRQKRRGTVADFINKRGRKHIHNQLYTEIYDDKQRYFIVAKTEILLKGQKKKRKKIIDNCLYKIAGIGGVKGVFIIFAYAHAFLTPFPKIQKL